MGSVGLLWNRGGYVWPFSSAGRKVIIQRLQEQGKILPVQVEGIEIPLFMRAQDRTLLEQVIHNADPLPRRPSSPHWTIWFGNAPCWRPCSIFIIAGSVYPPQKRQYGYYVLPVLYGDRFIARVEPVRQKRSGVLTIKGWWWEPDVTPDEAMLAAIQQCFERFCAFLSITSIEMNSHQMNPTETEWLKTNLQENYQNKKERT